MLAGENPQTRRHEINQMKRIEARFGARSIGHVNGPAKAHHRHGRNAARRDLGRAFFGIMRAHGNRGHAFPAFQHGAPFGVRFRGCQHAQDFEVILLQHHAIIAGAHMDGMHAARRHGEAGTRKSFGCLVQIPDQHDAMVNAAHMFQHGLPLSPKRAQAASSAAGFVLTRICCHPATATYHARHSTPGGSAQSACHPAPIAKAAAPDP